MKTFFLLILIFTSLTFAQTDKEAFKKEAQEVLEPIKKAFMKELRVGLKEGPYETVSVCHLKAPHISEGKFTDKYEVGRTSDKIRNSANSPTPWLADILKDYASSHMAKPVPGKVYQVKDKLAYVEPIYVKTVCLKCHGDLKGSIKKKIDELYPKDMATGYSVGEFRGLFYLKQK